MPMKGIQPRELRPGGWQQASEVADVSESSALWLVKVQEFRSVVSRFAGAVLDPGEKERAAAFRWDRDRDLYLTGHVALRLLLGIYLGLEPEDVVLDRLPCPSCLEPHGRPIVRMNPVHFSLSHSDGLCLLAFAATPVGVDIERVPDLAQADEISEALHPRETTELNGCEPEERPVALARVWVRKEAYLKGLGIGLGRDPALDYMGMAVEGSAQPPGWTIGDVKVAGGYAAAVAVAALQPPSPADLLDHQAGP